MRSRKITLSYAIKAYVTNRSTHVVKPGDNLGPRGRVGLDVAVEVDVHALPDVAGVQVLAQADGHDRRVCGERKNILFHFVELAEAEGDQLTDVLRSFFERKMSLSLALSACFATLLPQCCRVFHSALLRGRFSFRFARSARNLCFWRP